MFNRGLDKRNVFVNKKEFGRAKDLIKFYRHKETPQRFSKVSLQPTNIREKILANLYQTERIVDILAYCLMPNHFHLLGEVGEHPLELARKSAETGHARPFNRRH